MWVRVCVCACVFVHTPVRAHRYEYVCVHVCLYIHLHMLMAWVCVYMCVCTYTCACSWVWVSVYICALAHTPVCMLTGAWTCVSCLLLPFSTSLLEAGSLPEPGTQFLPATLEGRKPQWCSCLCLPVSWNEACSGCPPGTWDPNASRQDCSASTAGSWTTLSNPTESSLFKKKKKCIILNSFPFLIFENFTHLYKAS